MLQKIFRSKRNALLISLLVVVLLSMVLSAFYFFSYKGQTPWSNNEIPLTITNNNPGIFVILAKNDVSDLVSDLPFLSDKIATIKVDITNNKQLFSKNWDKGLTFAGYDAKIDEKGLVTVSIFADAQLLKDSGWSTAASARQIYALFIESLWYLELSKSGIGSNGALSDPSYQQLFQTKLNEKVSNLLNNYENENNNTIFLVEYGQ